METKPEPRQFELRQLGFNDDYYLSRIYRLEEILEEQPEQLQIDIVGESAIPADTALLIRSVLNERSPKTQLITNARSSVSGGSALIWLLGDVRMIREDAKLYFRRSDPSELSEVKLDERWLSPETSFDDSEAEANPGEDEHARVLEAINEYLPVKEMAGRMIGIPVLRQFGLLGNEALDQFLATSFGSKTAPESKTGSEAKVKPIGAEVKSPKSTSV